MSRTGELLEFGDQRGDTRDRAVTDEVEQVRPVVEVEDAANAGGVELRDALERVRRDERARIQRRHCFEALVAQERLRSEAVRRSESAGGHDARIRQALEITAGGDR